MTPCRESTVRLTSTIDGQITLVRNFFLFAFQTSLSFALVGTSLTWNFHVPALSLNAYAHGNTKDGYWASVEPGVAKSSKTEELLAAPRCLSCKSATNGPPAYPLGAQPFMQNGYSFTTGKFLCYSIPCSADRDAC